MGINDTVLDTPPAHGAAVTLAFPFVGSRPPNPELLSALGPLHGLCLPPLFCVLSASRCFLGTFQISSPVCFLRWWPSLTKCGKLPPRLLVSGSAPPDRTLRAPRVFALPAPAARRSTRPPCPHPHCDSLRQNPKPARTVSWFILRPHLYAGATDCSSASLSIHIHGSPGHSTVLAVLTRCSQ